MLQPQNNLNGPVEIQKIHHRGKRAPHRKYLQLETGSYHYGKKASPWKYLQLETGSCLQIQQLHKILSMLSHSGKSHSKSQSRFGNITTQK